MRNERDPLELPAGTTVWTYLRNSPGDNQTIESQEADVKRLCVEKGWKLMRIFMDRWKSGSSVEGREGFEQMIHLAKRKPRPAELLIINAYSRFGRNQNHAPFFRAELRMNGWQIYSMTDNIPAGDLAPVFEALVDWKNESFLIDLRAGTIRGLRYIADQGCLPTGQLCVGFKARGVPIGVKKDGSQRLGRKPEIDPEKAPLVIRAFELKASGAPVEMISKETGLYDAKSGAWSSFFLNRAYIGRYEFHGEVYSNIYPPLVSEELFNAVQRLIPPKKPRQMSGKTHPRRKGSKYILANVAVCACCGSVMEGKSATGHRYYVCSLHNKQASLCPEAGLIPADELEEEVLRILIQHILKPDYLESLLRWTNELLNEGLEGLELRYRSVCAELAEAEQICRRMTRNFALMETPTRMAEQLLREQDELVEQLRLDVMRIQQELTSSRLEVTESQIQHFLHSTGQLIECGEYYDLREVVETLCSRIVCSGSECRLDIHFPISA